jgi:hypothetical protein
VAKKAEKNVGMTAVSFNISVAHKELIEKACADESKRIGRTYGLAEYFRDSALHFVAKSYTVPEHDYARGRKPAAA